MVLTADNILQEELGFKFKYSLADDSSAPLVVMVHGRAGNFDVMWTFRRCLPEGASIIAPQAPIADPIGGFSWWLVREDWPKEEGVEAARRLNLFIDSTIKKFGLKPKKVIVVGFSQGGAILSLCVQERPEYFSGLALLASFCIKHPANVNPMLSGLPVFVGHGSKDDVVPLDKAMRGADFLRSIGAHITLVTDEVGHKIGSTAMRSLKDWINQSVL